jgi:hypothetical protein
MSPYSPGRRNPAPAPMADLVTQAKEKKAAIDEYDNATPGERQKLGIKRQHEGRNKRV